MTNKNSKKLNAFTLAEVLITLGIIGVVAAMTLPTLVQNYKKKVYSTRVHKAYAELLQAIKLSEIDNGPIQDWNCVKTIESSIDCVDKYIKPYYKDLRFCSSGFDGQCGGYVSAAGANYITQSGVGISMVFEPPTFHVVIDVNGGQKPNILGIDHFYFNTNNSKNMLLPHSFDAHPTREQIFQGYNDEHDIISCKKSRTEENELNRHACTLLLYLDNWEFKDDYPW